MTTTVRPALPTDLLVLPALELAADGIFAEHGIGPLPPVTTSTGELAHAAAVLVAGDPVAGFARLEVVDGQAHLEQVSVHPSAARRGFGTALVEASTVWAARAGHDWLTVSTFADVPWNGPWYARLGFVPVHDVGPGLRARRAREARLGLDRVGRRVMMRRGVGAEAVLEGLVTGLVDALGRDLLGLYAHGSLVAGDFDPARSDLDVLAVVRRPPDEHTLTAVAPVLEGIDSLHPGWRGRLEVETCALPTIAAWARSESPACTDAIMRVSPGEPLHLLPSSLHRVLTWSTVHRAGRLLAGGPADQVLPEVGPQLVRSAALAHVRDWPRWVEHMRPVGAQAYATLSICRAWCLLVEGEQRSKLSAADRVEEALPGDAGLVAWARDWWYGGGDDDEAGRFGEVREFVTRTSRHILEHPAR